MGKESAYKFVPARTADNPIPHLLGRKKQINEEIQTLERLVRIEACTKIYTQLRARLEIAVGEHLLPVTVVQKEADDEALLLMLLPELCKKFHPNMNIVIITGSHGGLIKSFKAQANAEYENIIFLDSSHIPHPQEVSDFISFALEQPFACHIILDDATPLIYAPILLRERLVLHKIEYPGPDALLSLLLEQYLPGLDLFRYLTNSTGEEYRIPFTFSQILQHIKYAVMYNPEVSMSEDKNFSILLETLVMAVHGLGGNSQKHNMASIYGLALGRRDFIASAFFRSVTSQLYILKRDLVSTIAGRLGVTTNVELGITKKWEEAILGIPSDSSFLNGVAQLKKAFTPNLHLSLWSALKTPQMYLPESNLPTALTKEYPDVCIAYRTLLAFPRLVNVHDWANVFASVLGHADLGDCAGRFLYALKCLLLVGVIRNKSKKAVPDFIERCNLGDACPY